jgi:hypothetical protein
MSHLLNKKFLASLTSIILLFVFILPVISIAENIYTPLIRCGLSGTGPYAVPCKFPEFIGLINRIINWIISIAGVIFTISAIWGGFLYMTSGEKPGNKDKAKSLLWSTLMGFVIILTAWLIVYTILNILVDTSDTGTPGIFKFLK